jgi:hypothetical protein
MKPTGDEDAVSALLAPLRDRTRDRLDDVTAARVLARAEATLSQPAFEGGAATGPSPTAPRALAGRWLVPATLMTWGTLYLWAAVAEIRVVYPRGPAPAREIALLTKSAAPPR